MVTQNQIKEILGELRKVAPAGYALAFHIRFTTPTFLFQTYAKDWLEYYSQNGLVMRDPTVAWGFENTGAVAWSALADNDEAGVLVKAGKHGMKFGLTCAVEHDGSRSLGSFARQDREFTAQETQTLRDATEQLHKLLTNIQDLSPETATALREMSINVTRA